MANRLSFEEAAARLAEYFPTSNFTLVEYQSVVRPCVIHCPTHGNQPISNFGGLKTSTHGCPACAKSSAKKLTTQDAQLKIDTKFPDSNVTIIKFNGAEYPCTLHHSEFGSAEFSVFSSILRNNKDTPSLHRAIQRKSQSLRRTKSIKEVQSDLDARYPNAYITIIEYNGTDSTGVLHHPDYGNLRYTRYADLKRYKTADRLLNSLSRTNRKTP